jgi:uncharacterized membrane protein
MARDSTQPSAMTGVVERNIRALLEHSEQQRRRSAAGQRLSDAITGFTGSLRFVVLHLLLFGGWIAVNLGWTPLPRFDPSFVILAMAASVEAIFLSTFVLISQNRMQELADQRANLDLQISLLAEHEITRLVVLVREIAQRLDIEAGKDPALDELAQDVHPEAVLDKMEDESARRSAD